MAWGPDNPKDDPVPGAKARESLPAVRPELIVRPDAPEADDTTDGAARDCGESTVGDRPDNAPSVGTPLLILDIIEF